MIEEKAATLWTGPEEWFVRILRKNRRKRKGNVSEVLHMFRLPRQMRPGRTGKRCLPGMPGEPKAGNGSEEQSGTVFKCSLGADDIRFWRN